MGVFDAIKKRFAKPERHIIDGKAKAVLDWANEWPVVDGLLKMNAIINKPDDASMNTITNDEFVKRFNDGTALREYSFQLCIVLDWSDGNDDTNTEAMSKASQWLDWVNEQYATGNLPDFGSNAEITEVRFAQNSPMLNAVYEGDSLAEYLIQVIIRYIE